MGSGTPPSNIEPTSSSAQVTTAGGSGAINCAIDGLVPAHVLRPPGSYPGEVGEIVVATDGPSLHVAGIKAALLEASPLAARIVSCHNRDHRYAGRIADERVVHVWNVR